MPPTSPDSTVLSEAYIFYPVHLPGPGYIAGPTLFPGRVIAGFHAKIEHYNPDTWARYILTQTRRYPTCTVVSSFLGVCFFFLFFSKKKEVWMPAVLLIGMLFFFYPAQL